MAEDRLSYLFQRYIEGSISREEYGAVWRELEAGLQRGALSPLLRQLWEASAKEPAMISDEMWDEKMKERMRKEVEEEFENLKIRKFENGGSPTGGGGISNKEQGMLNDEVDDVLSTGGIDIPEKNEVEVKVERKPRIIHIWRWVAAAAIIGFVAWGLWFVVGSPFDGAQGDSLRQAQTDINDVKAPEVNRAMIELSDGRQVYLDSAANGSLAIEEGVELVKNADGVIQYSLRQASRNERDRQTDIPVYNTLTNPRGSRVIDVTLSDGSRVWLNAGSSLRYPVVFGGDKREVEITGEGYFEVNTVNRQTSIVKAPSSSTEGGGTLRRQIPFYVRSGEVVTEVLGTHFNVNAYEDEGEVRVTLLEGSVNVKRESVKREGVKLVPGQSAVAKSMSNELSVMSGVDIEEVMAWKNGFFRYRSASLPSLMRQAARWYNVEVEYAGKIPSDTYSGSLPRSVSLGTWLKVLEESGVKFKISGKKVTILP